MWSNVSPLAGLAAIVLFSPVIRAAPYQPYPLEDGFPKPTSEQLLEIEKDAGGTIPNSPLPSSLQPGGVTTLQVIALNELFEVAYFTELLSNITNKVAGYTCDNETECDYLQQTLTTIINQEELHALSANAALVNANSTAMEPCSYAFPVADLKSAIALANTFTDVVLGVLPNAQAQFAADGGEELGLIPVVGSIIGQEGEQNGFYRSYQDKAASAAPFLTGVPPQFAFTALNSFFVPGSCPNLNLVNLTAFEALNVISTPAAKNSTLEFSCAGTVGTEDNSLVYLSGQNLPVVVPICNVVSVDGMTHFTADFPFESGFSKGLTIAALVKGVNLTFSDAADVAAATIYGPGLIEVD